MSRRACSILVALVLALGAPADAKDQYAAECAGIALTEAEAVATCVAASADTQNSVAHLFEKGDACPQIISRLILHRAMAENDGTLPPQVYQRVRGLTRPLAPEERHDCSIISGLVAEYSGTEPAWAACLGVEIAPDPAVALLRCATAVQDADFRNTNAKAGRDIYPPDLIGALSIPKGCSDLPALVHRAMRQVNFPDPDRAGLDAYLPDEIEMPDCTVLEPVAEISAEAWAAYDILRDQRTAAAKERAAQLRAQPGYKSILQRADESFQREMDAISDRRMEAAAARQQDPGTVTSGDVRRALIVEMQAHYPEERNEVAGIYAEMRHHAGGVGFRTNVRGGLEVNMGIRSVHGVQCDLDGQGNATCAFEATRASTANHRSLSAAEREGLNMLVTTFDLPPTQRARFEEALTYTNGQWRLAEPSQDLIGFLTPKPPQAEPSGDDDFGCGMAIAVGVGWAC